MSKCTRRIQRLPKMYKHNSMDNKDVLTEFNGCQRCTNITQWMTKMYKHNSMDVKDVQT